MPAPQSNADPRDQPRYRTNIPGTLCTSRITVQNIATHGAQVACPAMIFQFLKPKLKKAPIVLVISLDDSRIEVECIVAYINDDGNELLIGLNFTTLSGNDQDPLDKYVASLRERGAVTV